MLLDTVSEVTVGREVLLPQFILLDLEATLEDLLSLQIYVILENKNKRFINTLDAINVLRNGYLNH